MMNFKALLIFLTIFGVGFGTGFLVSGRLTKNSIEAVKERETPVGFKNDLYKYLKPDENQKRIIDSIVADYIPKIKEERAISRMYQKHLRDSMFAEIQSLLDIKQKDNLKKFEKDKIKKTSKQAIKLADTSKTVDKQLTLKKRLQEIRKDLTPQQQQKFDSTIEARKKERQNPEMKKELKVYYRQNIIPVLLQKRRNFEDELTEDEKATIEDIRTKRNAFRAEWLEGQITGEGMESKDMKDFMLESRKALQPILLNHKAELEKLEESIRPEREQWEADIDKIKAKYITDYKPKSDKLFKSKEKNAIDFLLMKGERRAGKRLRK
jgi:hypothetical protein